jgi:hypothetical protein
MDIFFPASIIIALVIGAISGVLISLVQVGGFWGKFLGFTSGSVSMGYFVVWVGVKIVPTHKKIVAFLIGVFAIAYSGMALYGNLYMRNFWGIWEMVVVIAVVGYQLYVISTNNTDFFY